MPIPHTALEQPATADVGHVLSVYVSPSDDTCASVGVPPDALAKNIAYTFNTTDTAVTSRGLL